MGSFGGGVLDFKILAEDLHPRLWASFPVFAAGRSPPPVCTAAIFCAFYPLFWLALLSTSGPFVSVCVPPDPPGGPWEIHRCGHVYILMDGLHPDIQVHFKIKTSKAQKIQKCMHAYACLSICLQHFWGFQQRPLKNPISLTFLVLPHNVRHFVPKEDKHEK